MQDPEGVERRLPAGASQGTPPGDRPAPARRREPARGGPFVVARRPPLDTSALPPPFTPPPEARALRERFDPGLPAFSAIGYRESWAFLDGELDLEAAIALDAQRNLAFAKRQATWFRREPALAVVDATDDPATEVLPALDLFVASLDG